MGGHEAFVGEAYGEGRRERTSVKPLSTCSSRPMGSFCDALTGRHFPLLYAQSFELDPMTRMLRKLEETRVGMMRSFRCLALSLR